MKAFRKRQKHDAYQAWKAGVSDEHLYRFVERGLIPFLKKAGYTVSLQPNKIVVCIREWAFAHVWIQRNKSKSLELSYMWSNTSYDEDAYSWYRNAVSYDSVFTLANRWQATEFLDESDVGIRQREDLLECMWHIIDLSGSKSHQDYINTLPYEDSDEEQYQVSHHEDTQAFGGDRRTQ